MAESVEQWRVVVNRELCMGSGMCIVLAPGTFSHDDEIKAVAEDPPGDPAEALQAAVEACPTGALSLLPRDRGA